MGKKGFVLIGTFLTIGALFFMCGRQHLHNQFAEIWNIDVQPGTEIYCKEHTDFFYGNRDTFIVYNADSALNYNFTYEKDIEMEEHIIEIADRLKVPHSKKPDFSKSYWYSEKMYKYGSNLTILYFPSDEKYYFIEEYFNSAN